jgi:hypothetical protein
LPTTVTEPQNYTPLQIDFENMLGLGSHLGLKCFYVRNEVKTRTKIPENRYGNASTSRSDQVIKRSQPKKPRSSRRN